MDSASSLTQCILLHRGAEADLYRIRIAGWDAILKNRVPKKYRQKELDEIIRRGRTVREASMISEAGKAGVRTSSVLMVDPNDCSLIISFIPGLLAREGIDKMPSKLQAALFQDIGHLIGLLHGAGIVHGDLTTSNIILSEWDRPFLIDFGLSSHSYEDEDRAVDLHLLRRSVATSHTANPGSCFRALFRGYAEVMREVEVRKVQRKTVEIAKRGRYFAIR